MSTTTVDGAACAAARAAMVAARRGEHQVLRSVATLEARGVAAAGGYRCTRRLLEELWHLDPARARRLVAQAALLAPRVSLTGQSLPPVLPATAAVAADGSVEDAHLRVIAATVDHLARIPALEPAEFAEAEQFLAEQATVLAPRALEKLARRLIDRLDPDGAAPTEEPQPVDEVHMVHRRDGTLAATVRIQGRADAELVTEVFDRLSGPAGPDDERSPAQRRAETLLDLCAQASSPTGIAAPDPPDSPDDPGGDDPAEHLDEPDDDQDDEDDEREGGDRELCPNAGWPEDLPDDPRRTESPGPEEPAPAAEPVGGPGRVPPALAGPAARGREATTGRAAGRDAGCPTVAVLGRAMLALTIDHQWLQAQVGHGLLDSEHALDPATARRLACDAGLVPMVLGSRSEPLDVGRLRYTVPAGLRRALHVRDGGCSYPGCTRRPQRCAAHHLVHWVDGGDTSLANMTLLCRYHHHLIHHDHWSITMVHGRPVYTPPPWIDPQQRPRPGGRTPLPL